MILFLIIAMMREKGDDTVFQGPNPWVSGHVKQTPHDPNMIWASNQYLIVFKVIKQIQILKFYG